MTRERQDRLLTQLARDGGWMTAGELADALGVTSRSVRSYVAAIKERARPHDVIASGADGYRLNVDAYAAFRAAEREDPADADSVSPRGRLYALIRRLVDADDGIDLYATAGELFVSESTLEADLGRVRALIGETRLTLERSGPRIRLSGPELARRRLLSRLFRDEAEGGMSELEAIQREFESESLGSFKTDLIAALEDRGYAFNGYGMDDVLLHVAIAADRGRKNRSVEQDERPASDGEIAAVLSELAERHFPPGLPDDDVSYLAYLLATRAVMPGPEVEASATASGYLRDEDLALMRAITTRASQEYLVDLRDEEFLTRLALHVRNLLERAQTRAFSRNPLTRSIKSAYPMIYELAVFIASQLRQLRGVEVNDDEIAYIAMHVGTHLQQQTRKAELLACVLVCPNYYDMHVQLQGRITQSLGDALSVVRVITRGDVSWGELGADIVLSTIEPPVPDDDVVVIHPFLGEADIDRVRAAAGRIRRVRRRAAITEQLLHHFDEGLFLRNVRARDEEAMIRILGERMVRLGIIDGAYVEQAIERERMSSTAFTDTLAMPHAMAMTATRTAIAIAVNENSTPWGGSRVNVVALVAFSAAGRAQFQSVFDQLVEVFSQRDDVLRIVRRADTFEAFIEELVRTIEE